MTEVLIEDQVRPEAAAPPVFISYSSKNGEIAGKVCAAIEAAGVEAWIAPRNVTPGLHYGECIVDAINACKLMVVIFSTPSNESEQVLREVERAVSKRVPIITFRIEDIVPTRSMEYFLSSQHWIDAFNAPIEPQVAALADTVKRMASVNFSTDRGGASATPWSPHKPAAHRGVSRRVLIAAAAAVPVAAGATWWFTRAGQSGVPVDAGAIAVLPFDNYTGEQSLNYLSRSTPDELTRLLTNLASIVVRPFMEVQRFVQEDAHVEDAGKGLGVGHVVSGSFSQVANGLKLGVVIIDSIHRQQVWQDALEVDAARLTDMMELMVARVGSFLRLQLDVDKIRTSIGSGDDRAYLLYLQAVSLEQDITKENNASAMQHLQDAIEADPQFALAYAALAECYVTSFYWNLTTGRTLLDQAETAAKQAIELRPDLAESHYALAYTYEGKGMRKEAVHEYFTSLRVNRRSPQAIADVARFLFYMAEFDRSIEMWDALSKIDPTNNLPRLRRAMCYFFKGDLDRAAAENAKAEKFARGVDQLTLVAFIYAWLKDFDAANRMLARLVKTDADAPQIAEVGAWIFTQQGKIPEARAKMKTIVDRNGTLFGIEDEIATFYAIQGDKDQAIDWLTKAVAAGAPNLAWYRSDFFASCRGDARYEAVIKQLSDEYDAVKKDIPSLR